MNKIPRFILADTVFWIGLLDKNDQYHQKSIMAFEKIRLFNFALPWPTLYEFLNTRLLGNSLCVAQFERSMAELSVSYIDDSPYRDRALKETIELAARGKRRVSFVDMIIRNMLQNESLHIDYLVTSDIHHFNDVCERRKIEIHSLQ